MNNIPSVRYLFNRLLIFLALFTTLSLLGSIDTVRKGHDRFYCGVTNVLFNLLNPEVYATFAQESRTDISHFGVSIGLYNRNKYTKKQLTKSYRKSINPDVIKFPNLHPIVLVPTLFLLSLFLTTPISWKSKMVRIPIALFVLYICLIFYYSYIFSITLNNGNFEFDSIWHIIIRPFGVDNAELINIFALIIWAFLSIPLIINHHTHKISV